MAVNARAHGIQQTGQFLTVLLLLLVVGTYEIAARFTRRLLGYATLETGGQLNKGLGRFIVFLRLHVCVLIDRAH